VIDRSLGTGGNITNTDSGEVTGTRVGQVGAIKNGVCAEYANDVAVTNTVVNLALRLRVISLSRISKRSMSSSSNLPPLPNVVGTDPSKCILDAFRISIAKRVAEALPPLTIEQAYMGVDYGKKGVDFTVALPRFRLPGKVDELASKVIGQVSSCLLASIPLFLMGISTVHS